MQALDGAVRHWLTLLIATADWGKTSPQRIVAVAAVSVCCCWTRRAWSSTVRLVAVACCQAWSIPDWGVLARPAEPLLRHACPGGGAARSLTAR
ncbi:MAG: hypothetical protein ACRDS9_00475 [Pseudonocardiaceae bacterium]